MTKKELLLELINSAKDKFQKCSKECNDAFSSSKKNIEEYNEKLAMLSAYGDMLSLLCEYFRQENLGILDTRRPNNG